MPGECVLWSGLISVSFLRTGCNKKGAPLRRAGFRELRKGHPRVFLLQKGLGLLSQLIAELSRCTKALRPASRYYVQLEKRSEWWELLRDSLGPSGKARPASQQPASCTPPRTELQLRGPLCEGEKRLFDYQT